MFVLYYHFTHAPHPKFVILLRRRFVIYIHIISGVLEFTSCWAAFLTGNKYIATIAALTAIFGHVPSAYYQTSIGFGAKALMVAGYLFAISLHLFSALHLFMEPTSVYWLLNMFLVHNIYVWCRVFYFFFGFTGLFKDTIYTNTVLTSGLILFPAVLGVSANMLFLGYVATSILLYFAIVQPNEEERVRYVNECTRDLLVNRTVHNAWIKQQERLAKLARNDELSDQQRAKQIFDQLDENKNGSLDNEEITRLLQEWQTATSFINRFSRLSKKQDMSFELFYRNIWRLGETSIGHIQDGIKRQGMARARFIFDCLDTNKSGYIDNLELQKLLIQWGLPENEVEDYLAGDDDKKFSFEEFYEKLKPIWDFAYENMSVRDMGQVVQPPDQKSQ
ncbi:unnamed protein product [Rotaria sordida]|uniref:EF-hand domain-containing protein n=2 Tax=Rotaria sordida TaxID=392033 RepID=A0A814ISM8_9BILA|nr:unnamed protein product [Rotaria sordida]